VKSPAVNVTVIQTAGMMFDAVRDLLQTTSLGTFAEEVESAANLPAGIVRPAQLISLTTRSTVAEALKVCPSNCDLCPSWSEILISCSCCQAFAEARILSAPVMNTTSGEYAGFLSTRDVLSALVKSKQPCRTAPIWQAAPVSCTNASTVCRCISKAQRSRLGRS